MNAARTTLRILVMAVIPVMMSAGCESKRYSGVVPTSHPATGKKPIRIELRATGQDRKGVVFVLDGKPFKSPKELGKALVPIAKVDPRRPVVIAPKDHVLWEHVVDAFSECVKAGLENVAFEPE